MTTRDEARRATADPRADGYRLDALDGRTERDRGARDADGSPSPGGASLPERLYAARERKGVDLYRAERDTKIRARYLAALERGEYRELPGDVYTKGFLRNYALYLGLDPEEVIGQWRRERGNAPTPKTVLAVPRPIAQPRPGLQFSPGIVVAALLTILIAGVAVWLGVQVQRFAKPPTLTMISPSAATIELDESATSFTFQGKSIPGATVTIEMAGGSRQVSADSTGAWSATVDVRRGRNTFTIDAIDPDTGKHTENPAQVVITVPLNVGQGPQGQSPTLQIDNPAEGTVFENGTIAVAGRATNATSVTISASYDGPATGAPASPSPSTAPSAAPGASGAPSGGSGGPTGPSITLPVTSDGTWDTGASPLQLTTGRWTITVKAANETSSTTLTTHVSVAYKGINLVVTIKGSSAWIKVWVDGALDPTIKSGRTFVDGKVLTFTGKTSIEVRTGSSGSTYFTMNGQSLGALGKRGIPETWLFQPPAAPKKTQRN